MCTRAQMSDSDSDDEAVSSFTEELKELKDLAKMKVIYKWEDDNPDYKRELKRVRKKYRTTAGVGDKPPKEKGRRRKFKWGAAAGLREKTKPVEKGFKEDKLEACQLLKKGTWVPYTRLTRPHVVPQVRRDTCSRTWTPSIAGSP